MPTGFSRRSRRPRGPSRPSNRRVGGCLLWLLMIILVLVVLSVLFGGFQMGTKSDGPARQLSCQPAHCHHSNAT